MFAEVSLVEMVSQVFAQVTAPDQETRNRGQLRLHELLVHGDFDVIAEIYAQAPDNQIDIIQLEKLRDAPLRA